MAEPENDADFFGRMISNKEKRKLNALNEK
jgi:hypothetical protein